jgi:hypothetical protein
LSEQKKGKLELIATKAVSSNQELYIVVDFLNKSLKSHNLIFGLTKDKDKDTMTISIYDTD